MDAHQRAFGLPSASRCGCAPGRPAGSGSRSRPSWRRCRTGRARRSKRRPPPSTPAAAPRRTGRWRRGNRASRSRGRDLPAAPDTARATPPAGSAASARLRARSAGAAPAARDSVRMPRSAKNTSSGRGAVADLRHRRAHRQEAFLVGDDSAEHRVGMAADVFGRGVDRHVDAVLERAEQVGRAPGVVHQHLGAVAVRHRGDRRDVLHLEGQRARQFAIDDLGVGPHQLRRCLRRSAGRNRSSRRRISSGCLAEIARRAVGTNRPSGNGRRRRAAPAAAPSPPPAPTTSASRDSRPRSCQQFFQREGPGVPCSP